jgi:hypothetical protein
VLDPDITELGSAHRKSLEVPRDHFHLSMEHLGRMNDAAEGQTAPWDRPAPSVVHHHRGSLCYPQTWRLGARGCSEISRRFTELLNMTGRIRLASRWLYGPAFSVSGVN